MSLTDRYDLERIQTGSAIGRRPDSDQQVWLDLFDDLFAEDAKELEEFQAYYDGEHQIKWNQDRFKEVFGRDFALRDNWCEVIVDACADRLNVLGFSATRLDHEDSDTTNPEDDQSDELPLDAEPTVVTRQAEPARPGEFEETVDPLVDKINNKVRAIMKRNKYESIAHRLHVGALVKKRSYLIVWPDADDANIARIWFNDANLIRVWYDENGEIEAAAKRWLRADGTTRQNLYFRDRIEKWVLQNISEPVNLEANRKPIVGRSGTQTWEWVAFSDEGDVSWPIDNPYDRVPVFPFVNKPHSSMEGLSEIKTAKTVQDAINKVIADGMVASEYAAFRQKIIASKGRPKEGWKHGPNMLWSTTDTDAKWGDFDATPLENFIAWIDMLVNHVAATTRTPQYMFFVTGDLPSGESLKTAEAGLVTKTKRKAVDFGDVHEEVVRFALEIELSTEFPDDLALECNWDEIETRIDKEFWEVQQIKKGIGVSTRQVLREGGYSDSEIADMEAEAQDLEQQDIGNALLQGFMNGTGPGTEMPTMPSGPG